jgi:HSP20 family molecular chaperone IbpA
LKEIVILKKAHMKTRTIPFASHEVRWFFEGQVNQHQALKHWFETVAGIPKNAGVNPPVWKGRLDDEPDIYLIIPGSDDMGIKWREGELQIKGRVSSCGTQVWGRHQGNVERWMKWSYHDTNRLAAYQQLFGAKKETGLLTVPVKKTRALRKVRLDTITGKAQEVDAQTVIDRGFGFELTDLEVAGKPYCSLAFEAFPNDSAMEAAFAQAVQIFLDGLKELNLAAAGSQSYPAWLGRFIEA